MCDIKQQDCKCHAAVMRTYKGMAKDVPPHVAMEAAQRVYAFHHPEDPKQTQTLTVERWVNAQHVQ